MPKYKLMVGRFPYGQREDSRCVDWLMRMAAKLATDDRFETVYGKLADTPITMTRNAMIHEAQQHKCDYLLIVDSDIAPDVELGADPEAKPFWESSIAYMLKSREPCVIAAPYCGPPPFENVYVFLWADHQTENPNCDGELKGYTREHAAQMTGITEVAALPTGLMLIDMRVFDGIPHPYTYYEWKDEGAPCVHCGVPKPGPQRQKGSTEDVTLTRDLSLTGRRQLCNWDAWAGHVKDKVVRKPRVWTADCVSERIREAIVAGRRQGDRVMDIKGDRFAADIARAEAEGPVNPHGPAVCKLADNMAAELKASASSVEQHLRLVIQAESDLVFMEKAKQQELAYGFRTQLTSDFTPTTLRPVTASDLFSG